jgi:hypothetical protein
MLPGSADILACGVSANDRLTDVSRQGWAALPGVPISRRYFHCFRALQRDMKAPKKINDEGVKSAKVFSDLSSCLRVFVVDFHSLSGIAHREVNRPSGESSYRDHARIELINGL